MLLSCSTFEISYLVNFQEFLCEHNAIAGCLNRVLLNFLVCGNSMADYKLEVGATLAPLICWPESLCSNRSPKNDQFC